ncbi:MAG TPA: hypothetical protein PLS71_02040, partial [Leptospiraceae bacterium]|nr:hypothetical protein [Leptospiraceae bacterium]
MQDIKNILTQNKNNLKNWIEENQIQAYRIYDRELENYPVAIDLYLNKAHIQVYESKNTEANDDLLIKNISDDVEIALGIPKINQYYKSRKRQKEGGQYEKVATTKERFIIKENGADFYVNLKDYLD